MFAHHGSAAYDMTKTITLKGVVTSYDFVNPHAEIRVEVTDSSGHKANWIAETNNPGRLVRRGWGRNTLKPGDVITKLNGKEVKDAADLTMRIGSFKPGDKVELTYMRAGAEKTAQVTLADQKNETVAKADGSQAKEQGATLGIQIAPAKEVAGSGDKGVAIVGVDPNGTAASQGLTVGDVILDVAGKPVSTPQDVKSGIESMKSQGKKAVMMRIQTADGARFVAVPFPKA